MYDSSEKKRYHRALCFIDRNCCSPKGWGTLIVKKSAARGHDIGYRVPMHRWQIARERIFVVFVAPRADDDRGKVAWSWKSHRDDESECLMSSCACSKTEGTRHPEEDGIEEIAQAWSLFVSPPSFASLSLPLAPQRSFQFPISRERTERIEEKISIHCLRNWTRLYSCKMANQGMLNRGK